MPFRTKIIRMNYIIGLFLLFAPFISDAQISEEKGRNMTGINSFSDQDTTEKEKENDDNVHNGGWVGYYNSTTYGMLLNTSGGKSNVSYRTINGYMFEGGIGLGISFDVYTVAPEAMPVTVEFRHEIEQKPFTPFFALRIGYGIPLTNFDINEGHDRTGGVAMNFEMGLRKFIAQHTGIIFSIGIHRLEDNVTRRIRWPVIGTEEEKKIYNRATIRFGFLFN
ncbi:MAG: hypothetical protein ABEH43_06600 [Flavobacteriales bacterium]